MTCREARDRLYETAEEDWSTPAGRELVAHLNACPACRDEQRLLRSMRRLLSTYGTAASPVDFTYLAARAPGRSLRGWRLPHLRYGAAVAMASMAVFAAVWQWQPDRGAPAAVHAPQSVVVRDVADPEELHRSFAVQQSLEARDGLILFAAEWAERGG